jgi:hypothetical protein
MAFMLVPLSFVKDILINCDHTFVRRYVCIVRILFKLNYMLLCSEGLGVNKSTLNCLLVVISLWHLSNCKFFYTRSHAIGDI